MYANEKFNDKNLNTKYKKQLLGSGKSMKKIILSIILTAICIFFAGCSGDDLVDQVANVVQEENENVISVKKGSPLNYPDITYEQAFESFFSDTTWKYFVGTNEGPDEDGDGLPDYTEENVDVVEFTGYCIYHDVEVKALIQFTLDKDADTFEATYLSFNDVPQSSIMLYALLEKAFTDDELQSAITDSSLEDNVQTEVNSENTSNSQPEDVHTENVSNEYVSEIKSRLAEIDNERNNADYGISTMDMVETESTFFEKYDLVLNEVYQHLKGSMSENDFTKLRDEQRKWLADKDAKVDEIYQQEGSISRLDAIAYNTDCTRDRCYALLEYAK